MIQLLEGYGSKKENLNPDTVVIAPDYLHVDGMEPKPYEERRRFSRHTLLQAARALKLLHSMGHNGVALTIEAAAHEVQRHTPWNGRDHCDAQLSKDSTPRADIETVSRAGMKHATFLLRHGKTHYAINAASQEYVGGQHLGGLTELACNLRDPKRWKRTQREILGKDNQLDALHFDLIDAVDRLAFVAFERGRKQVGQPRAEQVANEGKLLVEAVRSGMVRKAKLAYEAPRIGHYPYKDLTREQLVNLVEKLADGHLSEPTALVHRALYDQVEADAHRFRDALSERNDDLIEAHLTNKEIHTNIAFLQERLSDALDNSAAHTKRIGCVIGIDLAKGDDHAAVVLMRERVLTDMPNEKETVVEVIGSRTFPNGAEIRIDIDEWIAQVAADQQFCTCTSPPAAIVNEGECDNCGKFLRGEKE
jgi:hypothetical protein